MPSSFSSFSSITARTVPARATALLGARVGLVQITLAGVLWGTTGVVVQLVRESTGLSAVSISFYRLAIASVALLLLSTARLAPLLAALRLSPGPLVLVGVGLAGYQALYFLAVTTAGVSVATVISLGLAPVLTAGWEAARARHLPGASTVVPLIAGVGGLMLITMSSAHPTAAAPRPLLGLLVAIGSGIGYAATTVLSRHITQQVAPRSLTTLSTALGALVLAPLALMSGASVPVEPRPVAMLAYLGVVTTAVAYGLFYAGLRTTSSSAAAVLTLLEPLTAALLAVAVLSEPLPLPAVAGGVLLLGAVAALYLTPAQAPERPGMPTQ
jgi:DME family drug/metabolite transporter